LAGCGNARASARFGREQDREVAVDAGSDGCLLAAKRGMTSKRADCFVLRADDQAETRMEKLEALAIAVERWLADPRYVTEQLMMKALRELRELDCRT